jgi:hypothetical protein
LNGDGTGKQAQRREAWSYAWSGEMILDTTKGQPH